MIEIGSKAKSQAASSATRSSAKTARASRQTSSTVKADSNTCASAAVAGPVKLNSARKSG